jgi:hypothetical protein
MRTDAGPRTMIRLIEAGTIVIAPPIGVVPPIVVSAVG